MKKTFIVFVLLPVYSFLSQSDSEKPFPYEKMGSNLYKIEVDANSIIASIGPDGVLLCDVGGESKGPRVFATVRALGGDHINYIIDTHWHVDHTGANICFGKEATIIAHENVRKRLSEDKYLEFWDEKHPAFPEYALPDMVFNDRMAMHFNDEDIEIIHLPGGHTDGDAVVYFKKANILHVGDCLFSNGFPAIDFEMGGSVEGFADNLDKIASMMPPDVRIVVGHGPDYTMDELKAYEKMVRSSLGAVRKAMQKNISVDAMQRNHLLKEWESYSHGFFSCDEWIRMIYQSLIYGFNLDPQSSRYKPVLKGPYLGQKPPGMTPEVFAPGIVSTGLDELNSVFSPNGKEFYFCVRNYSGAVSIFQMKMEENNWSAPKLLPFASRFGDIDVTMSPDGDKILFSSLRPISGNDQPKEDYDFWMVEREKGTWGEPIYLGTDINSERHDFYPMMTNSGDIYFSSQREGPGTNNIYRSELVNGKYLKADKLDDAINTEHREFDPYIAPDESMLIFTSNRPEGFGSGDLYVSFRNKDGNWTKAKNMGERINTPGSEYCAMISPDGQYLFFTSARRSNRSIPDRLFDYEDFQRYHNNSNNGLSDIYWVDAKIIEALKPDEFE